jgi:glycosyltransferase involved in cell wall biosynthesis
MIGSMDGGGAERQTLLLLRHLSREKFAPELFLLKRGGAFYDRVPSDVPIHCFADATLTAGLNWPGKIHRQQVAFVHRLLVERNIDVVYDRTFLMTLIAGPAAEKANVPRVSTIVSPPSRAVPMNAGRLLWIKRKRLAHAYAHAAETIAVSSPAAQDARSYYRLKPRGIIAVPNPVDAAELDAIIASSPPPARDQRYTIACVGRMTKEKGHTFLIQALDCLRTQDPQFELPRVWMLGDGPLRLKLERQTQQLGLTEQVKFLGQIDQSAPWIAASDALCLPSTFEGFPNAMLEAMAIGTPVIASDIPVVRSLGRVAPNSEDRGRDYVAMFKSENAADLARKIRRLRLNPTATYSRMIAARNLARRALAIESILPRLEAIMLKAIPK